MRSFTGGPLTSPRQNRSNVRRNGSFGSSFSGRRQSLGMSPIRETDDLPGHEADEEEADDGPALARSVSFASIGSGRSTDRLRPRQPMDLATSASSTGFGVTSPRSVHGIRFSTSASPRHTRQSTGASSVQLRGDEFLGFSDNEVRVHASIC